MCIYGGYALWDMDMCFIKLKSTCPYSKVHIRAFGNMIVILDGTMQLGKTFFSHVAPDVQHSIDAPATVSISITMPNARSRIVSSAVAYSCESDAAIGMILYDATRGYRADAWKKNVPRIKDGVSCIHLVALVTGTVKPPNKTVEKSIAAISAKHNIRIIPHIVSVSSTATPNQGELRCMLDIVLDDPERVIGEWDTTATEQEVWQDETLFIDDEQVVMEHVPFSQVSVAARSMPEFAALEMFDLLAEVGRVPECPVCREDVTRTTFCKARKCGHTFCKTCLARLDTCAVCRSEF